MVQNSLEPITHFLTGAVLARTGFNRKTALATATMTLAAEAPDLDIFWRFKGPVYYFAHHRGFTHSFLGLFLMSGLTVGLMYLVWLLRAKRTNIPDLPPRWGLLFVYSYIAGLSHILLDFTNNYGVRPFWPFWEKWYSWDIVFIVEPALYVILIVGLVLPAIASRREPLPRGRREATIAAFCVLALYAARDYEHQKAVHAFGAMQFESEAVLENPKRVSVYPYFWTLTRWYAVAETRDFFASADVESPTGTLNLETMEIVPKSPETPATLAAKQSYLGRAYLDWAQYPLLTETAAGQNAIVHFRDLRFDYPQFRGKITLSGAVELDKDLHIVSEAFGATQPLSPAN